MIPIVPVTASYSDHEEAADGTTPQECVSHQGCEQDTAARLGETQLPEWQGWKQILTMSQLYH